MSFYSIDKATTSISSETSQTVHRQVLTGFFPAQSTSKQKNSERAPPQPLISQFNSCSELNVWFIGALVAAGQCKKHFFRRISPYSFQSIRRPRIQYGMGYSVAGHRPLHMPVQSIKRVHTREELLALVDQYDSYSPPDPSSLHHSGDGPRFNISDRAKDYNWPNHRYQWPPRCTEERQDIERLQEALKDKNSNPQYLYDLYRSLPAPRVPYLTAATRHNLLYSLGVLERKDEAAMLRYMSVIDDMQAAGIPLTVYEWNCATSFAGRYVAKTTEVEVEATLRLWKEMEYGSGIRANSATFNILFDTATKAGKFELAEMIYREMESRGHAFNRFHHVSLIHYFGLRADGEGVRKAYKALVEAGEIVDTVVLNCTISSLIRAYEPQAAQQVFERMKRLHAEEQSGLLPPRDFKKKKKVTKVLMRMATLAKGNPAKLRTFQKHASIAPDIQTYRILIQYLSVRYGDLQRVAVLLDEMRWYKIPPHGSIFLALLKGFAIHGGILYSYWTADRLESVWKAYLQAVDQQVADVYIGKWIVCWVLRAFSRCSGKTRTVEVWEEIKGKWTAEHDDLMAVMKVLRSVIDNDAV